MGLSPEFICLSGGDRLAWLGSQASSASKAWQYLQCKCYRRDDTCFKVKSKQPFPSTAASGIIINAKTGKWQGDWECVLVKTWYKNNPKSQATDEMSESSEYMAKEVIKSMWTLSFRLNEALPAVQSVLLQRADQSPAGALVIS